jgi:hypothetical protein
VIARYNDRPEENLALEVSTLETMLDQPGYRESNADYPLLIAYDLAKERGLL